MTTTPELARGQRLIPRELLWMYFVAPLPATPVFIVRFFEQPVAQMLRSFLVVCAPFAAVALSFHLLYTCVMPALVGRIAGPRGRWAVHAIVATAVPVLLVPGLRPVEEWIKGAEIPLAHLLVPAVVVSWAFLLPALLIQNMRNRVSAAEAQATREHHAALEAKLEALQARINPHFFFNSINTVASLIPSDPELAEHILEQLADIVRYALDATRAQTVRLGRELDVVRDYLAIQQARFTARLDVRIDLDPRALEVQVPPLLVQPLVENAMLHGLANRAGGQIRLEVCHCDTWVEIAVSDDGPGPAGSSHRGSQTSLRDLRKRIHLIYGDHAALELEHRAEGGCRSRLRLPTRWPA